MIRSRFASPLALAALLAVPAFAQTTPQADVSSGTTMSHGAYVAPLEKAGAKQTAAAEAAKPAKSTRTTTSMDAHADVSCGTTTANSAYVAPLEKAGAKQQAAADGKSVEPTVAADCVAKPVKTAKKKSAKTASTQ